MKKLKREKINIKARNYLDDNRETINMQDSGNFKENQ